MSDERPQVGQVWADNDPRSVGRTVRVERIEAAIAPKPHPRWRSAGRVVDGERLEVARRELAHLAARTAVGVNVRDAEKPAMAGEQEEQG